MLFKIRSFFCGVHHSIFAPATHELLQHVQSGGWLIHWDHMPCIVDPQKHKVGNLFELPVFGSCSVSPVYVLFVVEFELFAPF